MRKADVVAPEAYLCGDCGEDTTICECQGSRVDKDFDLVDDHGSEWDYLPEVQQ